jgi:hypothetical protein
LSASAENSSRTTVFTESRRHFRFATSGLLARSGYRHETAWGSTCLFPICFPEHSAACRRARDQSWPAKASKQFMTGTQWHHHIHGRLGIEPLPPRARPPLCCGCSIPLSLRHGLNPWLRLGRPRPIYAASALLSSTHHGRPIIWSGAQRHDLARTSFDNGEHVIGPPRQCRCYLARVWQCLCALLRSHAGSIAMFGKKK